MGPLKVKRRFLACAGATHKALRGRIAPVALGIWTCIAVVAQAATVTRQVFINFNGTLPSGNTYTLGPGELDVTGTFRKNGSATIAGGVADVPGNVNATSGFLFSSASLPSLTTASWISEAVLVPDVPASGQPGAFNHFLDVRGDLFFRYNGNTAAPKFTQFGFYDGSTEPNRTTPDLSTDQYSHVALVWNAGARTLEGYIDGVSQGTLSTGNVFATPSVNVGYGFFARTGFLNRAFDGKLASVAFSTYSGAFSPGFGLGGDFQLDPTDTPALVLELVVNTVSGKISIENNTQSSLALNGYQITSALGSLDYTNDAWLSLQDQNLDPVSGGDAPGETWQEAANPSAKSLFEGFLLGSTTLDPGESLNLGRAYNEFIAAEDLEFSFRLAAESGVVTGIVRYDDTPPPPLYGDYNNNGRVDAADYTVWRNLRNTSATMRNDQTPESVSDSDYAVWKANFGQSFGSGAANANRNATAVPELASLPLAVAAMALSAVIRSRAINRRRARRTQSETRTESC